MNALVETLVEVALHEDSDFLKIKETLTRIGVASRKESKLYQTIASLLEEWKLLKIVDKTKVAEPKAPMSQIKVISFKDKGNWTLESKYSIGRPKKQVDA